MNFALLLPWNFSQQQRPSRGEQEQQQASQQQNTGCLYAMCTHFQNLAMQSRNLTKNKQAGL
jgi:hypothetical protein